MSQQEELQENVQLDTHPGKEDVVITIDNKPSSIHRGRHSVAELKTLGNVPLAHELLQVINGVLTPLPDDGEVTIKGGEVFLSEPHGGRFS